MKRKTAFACAFLAGITAPCVVAAPPQPLNRAAEIARLLQTWQSRILVNGLPVDDAKNWSLRNMQRFARLSDERLALAQEAATLPELELALVEAPLATGSPLDVLMANPPGNMSMIRARTGAKSSPASSPSSYAGLVFTALNPCRILDTRPSQGGTGAWAAATSNLVKIGPYSTAGGGYQTGAGAQGGSATSCGLDALAGPGQVAAIMAAVSTVAQAGPGYLTFYPQGSPNPGPTSVSQWFQPGYVQTSFVMIPSDLSGTVAALGYTSVATDVVIDVVGYFAANAGSGNITLVQSTASAGNIMKGGNRFIHNFGVQNAFVGELAGNFAMTGTQNTASGYGALQSDTTGNSNTAIGWNTLISNATGSNDAALGSSALSSNTAGANNTASGAFALSHNTTGNNNTASGFQALLSNTNGGYNTASGYEALVFNTGGFYNNASGAAALFNNTTGSSNIALGHLAGLNLTTGDFNIDIGNQGVAAEGNTIRIGDSSQTRTFLSGIRGVTTDNADGVAVLIDSNGQLGTASSSRRFKDGIADMEAASSALMKLRPVTFHYKSDARSTLQYGLVAEEVAEVYPGLVARSNDGQVETVMYQFLPPMLLNEYQKQQRAIRALQAEVATLKAAMAQAASPKAPAPR